MAASQQENAKARPLDDILVVSLEQAVSAPYCTRLLGDQGARVIKVERPDGGDFARAYDTRIRGESSYFIWGNRSKESLTLDLKSPDAIASLKSILARADVFVQNLAPGAAERLGLGEAELRKENPRLITCSISGFGPGGPYEGRKAYDLLIQAEAGLLSITGTPDTPAKSGISIADICSGVTAYHSILAALLMRAKTGTGDHIEISMLEAMAEWMGYPMYYAYDGAPPPPRTGAGHATIYPYGPFETSDGQVLFGLQNDREWKAFCEQVLERLDMAQDPRFIGSSGRTEHRDVIAAAIAEVLPQLTTAEALSRLERAGIATAQVRDMAGLWAHPQLAARGRWQQIDTPTGAMPALTPVSGQSWTPQMAPVPRLGEHTQQILEEFGAGSVPDATPDPKDGAK
ncbi:MAG: CaiB/BaiF CoA-transferase family protein [Roseovarius sp.]|nr:CaiB/BaiF CoA-transferase family protein [Roseovarius sp.]